MKFDARLDRSLESLKTDAGHDPDAPAVNPFGPDSSTAGSTNWDMDNSAYLGDAPGSGNRYKAARWLAATDDPADAASQMADTTMAVLAERSELPENDVLKDAIRNFLQSTYTAKHAWKADVCETAAVEALADELGATVLHGESPDKAAELEGEDVDRRLLVDGEIQTAQVKTNTDNKVKGDPDWRLDVTAEPDSREVTVEATRL